jgi:hypothetical protein
MTNETYSIEVTSPLLRPGITIRTEVSKQYIIEVTRDLLDIVRDINSNRSITIDAVARQDFIDRLAVTNNPNTCGGPYGVNTVNTSR